ncbi:MAG: tRNA (adenosine(37)-N6)-threonylcarbamoyltransferase complex dimerization subunit type 1 TsaB [Candidatus Omnitrophica bacterium]|nr:tRNA (adenosine(37)-N6)-threonylcarbamoyltransferase complex dimerization subunit type 1 TsaB [Candidatus Omnitrophota bacterium]MCM8807704.1 tRNA (adenosine(37)-N6)-threonylcarbamoyltransferase complex dimerization subunit type 1 TsaB [Candidatus Omnitrophota bacterium]
MRLLKISQTELNLKRENLNEMKLLSIETTGNIGSIAFLKDNEVKREIIFESLDIAGELVEKMGFIYEDFDYIVVSTGPGSWTGIRIGLSFAKGLSCGEKDKIYCINIFESFFYAVKNLKRKVICIVPSTKKRFYFSIMEKNFNYEGKFEIKESPLEKIIPIVKKDKYILIGSGVKDIVNFLKLEEIETLEFLWYPRASLNGLLAYEKIKRNIPSPLIEPIYGK